MHDVDLAWHKSLLKSGWTRMIGMWIRPEDKDNCEGKLYDLGEALVEQRRRERLDTSP